MKTVQIDNRKIGDGQPVFVIAEAGVNHNGDVELARQLIDAAKESGADAVKFQTFKTEKVLVRDAPKAAYQKSAEGGDESYWEMGKKLELSYDDFRELNAYCEECGILFLSTPFDSESADFLNALGMPIFKISSGEVTNLPFLAHVARFGKPIILSTGMASLEEVAEAVSVLRTGGCRDVILLQCTTNYPADPADANLLAMTAMRERFDTLVGYSDHVKSNLVSFASVALGACVVEKHFTLDKRLPGPDHQASLEPDELSDLTEGISMVSISLGDGVKRPASSEAETTIVARRSLVAGVDLEPGMVLDMSQVEILRPGSGLSPALLATLTGQKLVRHVKAGTLLSREDFEETTDA